VLRTPSCGRGVVRSCAQKIEKRIRFEFGILNLFGILDFEFGISAGLPVVVWDFEFGILNFSETERPSCAQFRSGLPVLRVC